MKFFGMTEADLPAADDELEFEQVVKFEADYLLVVEAGGTKGDVSSRGDAQSYLYVDQASLDWGNQKEKFLFTKGKINFAGFI